LIKLIHYFKKEILYNTDYLFKQNEESDFIYIIENGNFDLYCYLSLGWIKEYYNYIEYSKSNLIIFLFGKSPIDDEEIDNLFLKAKNKKIESPMIFNHNNNEIYTISTPKKLNFVEFENEQIKNFDNNNIFKVRIKTIKNPDILGFEDSLELKNRFYFAKCVSKKAEVKKINIIDFHKLISTLDNENNKNFFMEMINSRKDNILKIIKKEVEMKLNKINNEFEMNFNDFLKGKGKFSYDKIDEKEKSKNLVKQVSYKKIYNLKNNKRLSKPYVKIRPNNSQRNYLKIRSLNLNRTNLPNLTYSNFNNKIENKIQSDINIISENNNFNKNSDRNIVLNKKFV
jgi:CRP-like cAMP-binding protein